MFIASRGSNVCFTPFTTTNSTIAKPFTCRTAVFIIIRIKFTLRIPEKETDNTHKSASRLYKTKPKKKKVYRNA